MANVANPVIIDSNGPGLLDSDETSWGSDDFIPASDTSNGFPMEPKDFGSSSLEMGLFHNQTPANVVHRKLHHLKQKFHCYFHYMKGLTIMKTTFSDG